MGHTGGIGLADFFTGIHLAIAIAVHIDAGAGNQAVINHHLERLCG